MMARVMTEGFESVGGRASSVRARDAETPAVLAADVGSSSVRAALFDARGREIEGTAAQVVRDFRTAGGGGAEERRRPARARAARRAQEFDRRARADV